jgi:hypothetical protein
MRIVSLTHFSLSLPHKCTRGETDREGERERRREYNERCFAVVVVVVVVILSLSRTGKQSALEESKRL